MSPRSKGLLLASLTLIGLGIAAGRPGFQLNAAVWVFFGLAAVFVLSALFGDAWQQYRDRRRARLPTDDELGWFDHGERIEPLWRQRWRLNNRLYVDATWMDRQITAALATISDVHSSVAVETELPHLLDRLAKRLRRRIHVFEEFATTHALTVEALLRGYSKVLERGGSVVVVPGALASFRKRADRQLHQHLARTGSGYLASHSPKRPKRQRIHVPVFA